MQQIEHTRVVVQQLESVSPELNEDVNELLYEPLEGNLQAQQQTESQNKTAKPHYGWFIDPKTS